MIIVRNQGETVANALALANNLQLQSSSQVGPYPHADSSSTDMADTGFLLPGPGTMKVTAPAATNLATSLVLAQNILGVLIGGGQTTDPPAHFYDAPANSPVKAGVHLVQDSVNIAALVSLIGTAVDLPTAMTMANAIRTYYAAHRTQSGVHYNSDTVNASTATASLDLAGLITLLNDLKTVVTNHVGDAPPTSQMIRVISP
jgi:hypothetical protein